MNNVLSKSKVVLLLFVVVGAFISLSNSLIVYLDIYSTFSWVIDYRFGFCKRGFLGTLYHIYLAITDSELTYRILERDVFISHLSLSFTSCLLLIILFIDVFKRIDDKFFVVGLFSLLIGSFFIKNVYSLTGYLDLWIYNIYLIILLLIVRKHITSAMVLACISCLFTELGCVFWCSVFIPFLLKNGFSKRSLIYTLPFFCGVLVHSAGVPTSHLIDFYRSFSFELNQSIQDGIDELFGKQYSLLNYIPERLTFISEYFGVLFISFLLLGFASLLNFTLGLTLIDYKLLRLPKRIFVILLMFFAVFAPLLLVLISIDYWRFVGFAVFSSFVFLVSFAFIPVFESKSQLCVPSFESMVRLRNGALLCGICLSLFTLFLPPIRSFGTYFMAMTPTFFNYMGGDRGFVLTPFLIDNDLLFSSLAIFNNTHDIFQKKLEGSNIEASKFGNKYSAGSQQLYGKTRLVIEASFLPNDKDSKKIIEIYGLRFEIFNGKTNEFEFDLPSYLVGRYPALIIKFEPSSEDWVIKQFRIENVD